MALKLILFPSHHWGQNIDRGERPFLLSFLDFQAPNVLEVDLSALWPWNTAVITICQLRRHWDFCWIVFTCFPQHVTEAIFSHWNISQPVLCHHPQGGFSRPGLDPSGLSREWKPVVWKLILLMNKEFTHSRSYSPKLQIYLRILKSWRATRTLIFMRTSWSSEKALNWLELTWKRWRDWHDSWVQMKSGRKPFLPVPILGFLTWMAHPPLFTFLLPSIRASLTRVSWHIKESLKIQPHPFSLLT